MRLLYDGAGTQCRLECEEGQLLALNDWINQAEVHGAAFLSLLAEQEVDEHLLLSMFRKLPAPYRLDRKKLGFFLPEDAFARHMERLRAEGTRIDGPTVEVFGVKFYPIRDLSGVILLTRVDNWPFLVDAEGTVLARKIR